MASSIVKSIAQQLGNLVVEEAKSLHKVKEKIESLQKDLEMMESFLRTADSQPRQERDNICIWVSDVQDLAYDAEDIVERYLHDVSDPHRRDGVWNTLKWGSRLLYTGGAYTLHNLGSDADELRNKLSKLHSRLALSVELNTIMPTSGMEYNTKFMEERRTYPDPEQDVIGMVNDTQEVVHQLVEKDVNVVCICGIGGLGKTTLAKKVFEHKDIKDHFNDNCAWVYLSKEFEKWNVFQLILLQLVMDEKGTKRIKELHEQQLPGELHTVLQQKACLVVIDDIWTHKAWESLKPGLGSACSNTSTSKILFTSRYQGLLQHVDARGYTHPLNPLSPDESWQLLQKKAFTRHGTTDDDDQVKHEAGMEKLGKEMLNHCGGLPLAIVALGGILSSKKTVPEWEMVKNNLSDYLINDVNEGVGDGNLTFKVLELSYYDLPFYLKPCFLYLGIFHEDYSISAHMLYHLWEAEGFLVEGLGIKREGTCYNVGVGYLEELVQRSMVKVGERWPSTNAIKTCRVHDVMREMCLRKCREVGFLDFIGCNESDSVHTCRMKKLRRCALNDKEGDFLDKHFEHGAVVTSLRSLLLFQDQKQVQHIWKCCPMLRVLDLQGMSSSIDGVGDLSHLRYLNLKMSQVEVLPSCLYDLKYLETLDLGSRRFKVVGRIKLKNKFDKMKKLRHLYLPKIYEVEGGERLKFPNDGMQMESLKNFDIQRCEMTQLSRMTKLRVFSICKYSYFEEGEDLKSIWMAPVIKNEGRLINSIRLNIRAKYEEPLVLSSVARDIGVLFLKTLKRVDLWYCIIGEGEVFALEKLLHLKNLTLLGGGIGKKLSFSTGSFPQLIDLEISVQTELEKWEVGEGALPNLQRLHLSRCKELEEWEVRKGALPKLQRLWLFGCVKLLKTLNNFPQSLTNVSLVECCIEEGGSLPSALENLPHLKFLLVGEGRRSHRMCGTEEGDNKGLRFSPRSFPQLTRLRLKELAGLEFGDGAFPNLQFLELEKCEIGVSLSAFENRPRLRELTLEIPSIQGGGNKLSFRAASFPQLRELEIKYAEELEELEIEDGALPNLECLRVVGCSKLNKFFHNLHDLPLLQVDLG